MPGLRLWAPFAQRVELVRARANAAERHREPLHRTPDGFFESTGEPLTHGERYGFRIDGEGPFPDPRSRSQPDGVHALSAWVDHDRFAWHDAGFRPAPLDEALLYELHIGTFSPEGTFDGAIAKLEHLARLGVTHVELMPVASFGGRRGWGYDGVVLFAPHAPYGGPDGLKRLVDGCHAQGLAVLIDVVYNHFGPSGNYLGRFGPYVTQGRTPWGEATNLDGDGSREVRRFFVDNALAWLRDYHADGLRLDAVQALVDGSTPHFLAELGEAVAKLETETGKRYAVIAETNQNDPTIVRSRARGGYGLAAHWCDDLHHALHSYLTGERHGYYADYGRLADVAKALARGYVLDGGPSRYYGHPVGQAPEGVSGTQIVSYIQTHDQVGNRPGGERLARLVGVAEQKMAAALLFMSPFVPMLFQGEEWGSRRPFLFFADHDEPALRRAVRAGRKREYAHFGWSIARAPSPDAPSTFRRSQLDWAEPASPPRAAMLAWYRALAALRRSHPALGTGALETTQVDFDEAARWLRLRRGPIVGYFNFAPQGHRFELEGGVELRLASSTRTRLGPSHLVVAPRSVAIAALTPPAIAG